MINMSKPKNLNNYICVDSEMGKILHQKGFQPIYRDGENLYFLKTSEISKVVKENA